MKTRHKRAAAYVLVGDTIHRAATLVHPVGIGFGLVPMMMMMMMRMMMRMMMEEEGLGGRDGLACHISEAQRRIV